MTDQTPLPEDDVDLGDRHFQSVEALGRILQEYDLSEILVEDGKYRVRLSRQLGAVAAPHPVAPIVAVATPASIRTPSPDAEHPGTVKSPMVGTVFRRPSATSAPFVEIGAQVKLGDKLLLVEAMKTFNEIVAPRSGTVTEILISDGEPVEFGQKLLVIA